MGGETTVLFVHENNALNEPLYNALLGLPEVVVVGRAFNLSMAIATAKAREAKVLLVNVMNSADVELLKGLRRDTSLPIVAIARTAELGVRAMASGAVEVLNLDASAAEVVGAIRLMSEMHMVGLHRRPPESAPADVVKPAELPAERDPLPPEVQLFKRLPPRENNGRTRLTDLPVNQQARLAAASGKPRLVVVGASTGGPAALAELLKRLPANFPAPILIAQHMPDDFPAPFADWLEAVTDLRVNVGKTGLLIEPGTVYVSPADEDMIVGSSGMLITKAPRGKGPRPSVDRLFASVAGLQGYETYAVVLTGMGRDGAEGLKALRHAGAHTVVQSRASCVVSSMPDASIEVGAAEAMLPPAVIGDQLAIWALGKVRID